MRCELGWISQSVAVGHRDRLLNSPSAFRRSTGPTPVAFRRLLAEVPTAEGLDRTRREGRSGRRRKAGAGRKPAPPPADRPLMLRISYRTCVPPTFRASLVGLDDSNVCRVT